MSICKICEEGNPITVLCRECPSGEQLMCAECDRCEHRRTSCAGHRRCAPPRCQSCQEEGSIVEFVCCDCPAQQFMCAECDRGEHRRPICKGHRRVAWLETICEWCQEDGSIVEFACSECNQLMCAECDKDAHRNHTRMNHVRSSLSCQAPTVAAVAAVALPPQRQMAAVLLPQLTPSQQQQSSAFMAFVAGQSVGPMPAPAVAAVAQQQQRQVAAVAAVAQQHPPWVQNFIGHLGHGETACIEYKSSNFEGAKRHAQKTMFAPLLAFLNRETAGPADDGSAVLALGVDDIGTVRGMPTVALDNVRAWLNDEFLQRVTHPARVRQCIEPYVLEGGAGLVQGQCLVLFHVQSCSGQLPGEFEGVARRPRMMPRGAVVLRESVIGGLVTMRFGTAEVAYVRKAAHANHGPASIPFVAMADADEANRAAMPRLLISGCAVWDAQQKADGFWSDANEA